MEEPVAASDALQQIDVLLASRVGLAVAVYRQWFTDAANLAANRHFGGPFRIIRSALFQQIALGVCRLLDPSSQGDKKNFTLDRVKNELPGHAAVIDDWKRKHDCEIRKIKAFRDKHLAHQDLAAWKSYFDQGGCFPVGEALVLELFDAVSGLVCQLRGSGSPHDCIPNVKTACDRILGLIALGESYEGLARDLTDGKSAEARPDRPGPGERPSSHGADQREEP